MKQKVIFTLAFAAVTVAILITSIPLRASETDDRIESSFKNTHIFQTYLKDDVIKIESKDGAITLTGTVAEEAHKALAQETVASLPGVTRVDNRLATKVETDAENLDVWIVKKVKLALLFHRNVNSSKTSVEAKDRIVTLRGEASTTAQKKLTSEYAEDIQGVKEVKNEMTVAATPDRTERTTAEKIDDASITAQIKIALALHRSTSTIKTNVETRKGEVKLTGIAKNKAEKFMVSKLVADIHGVDSVINQMTVSEPTIE